MQADNKPNFYAVIPASVRYDKNITPNAKLLYGEITSLCNEKGYCWASNQYFANLYEVSKVSISKWINELQNAGYVQCEIIYKDGSKEILNRYIKIVYDPIKEKLNTPIKENFKDNNTNINNTDNKALDEFELFWKEYPNHQGRKKANQAWIKSKPNITEVLKSLKWQKQIWAKDDNKFVPMPATYINGERWHDEPPKKVKSDEIPEWRRGML